MRPTTSLKVMAVLLGTALPLQQPALAQEATVDVAAEPASDGADAASALYTAADLDALLAPVALYPDALLAQVLLATTYPVDVLMADRFLTKNAELDDKARSALAADQTWSDPVKELTAGFPELISRMAEHMDWTEQAGDAILAQTDDVLASLQRLRAQAKLNGYLEDNDAMTVEEDADSGNITISSANPEVVYVPQYTDTVYTQPAPATPVYVTDDNNWDDLLVTGAVIWGSSIILDEIFDDDDWDGGRDHWYGGGYGGGYGGNGNGNGNSIDWNGDLNVDNGINIGNGNGNGRPGLGNRPGNGGGGINIGNGNGNGIGNGNGNGNNIGNGNGNGGLDLGNVNRPTTLPGKVPGRLGNVDPDRLPGKPDGNFKPSDASRDSAREKIANSKKKKDGVATLPAASGKRDLGRVEAGKERPAIKIQERPKGPAKVDRGKVKPDKMAKPKNASRPKAGKATGAAKKPPVYLPSTGSRGKASSVRGKKSMKGNR